MQISGLGSGIDTASMVKQLMSVERLSGQHLTKGKASSQALVSAFTSLNTKMKALTESAEKFVPKSVLSTSAWNQAKATSSNEDIAKATTTAGAKAGTLTFAVASLAQSHTMIGGKEFAASAPVNGGEAFSLQVTVNSETKTVNVGGGAKLADVVSAINDQAGTAVQATMVQVSEGKYKVQLNSTNTGTANKVTISPNGADSVLGGFNEVNAAADTVLQVGSGPGAYTITSATRDVKDALPGVTITPTKADAATQVTVHVGNDVKTMGDDVESMVKAANEALSNIKINSNYVKDRPTDSGPFVADSTTRGITYAIRDAVVGSSSLIPSLAGISVDKNGTVTFDRAAFESAYKDDPSKTQNTVNGVAERLAAVGTKASDAKNGSIAQRITSEQSMVSNYTKQITRFEDRMTLREQSLSAQFQAMESLLGKMQSQGNWLAGQLATLPTGGY